LLDFDQSLFLIINNNLSNGLFDVLMPWIRSKYIWAPIYMFIISFAFFNMKTKAAYGFILSLLLVVGTADLLSSKLIKNQVERVRPCNNADLNDLMIKRIECGTGYSFTSSHATNHFALSFFLISVIGFISRRLVFGLIFWACIVSFAQIYVGVHYPLDVIFGGVLGVVVGSVIGELYKRTSLFR